MKMLAVFLFCLIASGCSVISERVNANWPPLTTTDQQLKAINQSNENRISNIDAMLFLSNRDFNRLANKISNDYFSKLTGKNIDNFAVVDDIEINNISLVKQGALISGNFKLNVVKYNINIAGEMTGIAALATNDSFLKILPAFSYIKLDSLVHSDEQSLISILGKKAAIDLINAILNEFLDNINGVIAKDPISIPLNLAFSKNISLGEMAKAGDSTPSFNQGLNVAISMNYYLPFINEQGVVFLATSQGKSEMDDTLKQSDNLDSAFSEFTAYVKNITSEQLNVSIDNLSQKSTFLVRKDFIASTFNKAVEGLVIDFNKSNFIDIPQKDRMFNQSIEFHKPDRLPSCDGLYKSFAGYDCAECSQDSCNGPCNYANCQSCRPWQVACLARSAACQAGNAARVAGCAVCKSTAISAKAACDVGVAACKATRETQRVAHQVANEADVAACKVVRESTRIVNDLKQVATINGEFGVKSSTLHAIATQLKFNDDLSQFSVNGEINANADSWLKVHVNPQGFGHIACVFPFQKTLETSASSSKNNQTFTASISTVPTNNNSITLKAVTDPVAVHVKLMPPPYFQLIQDPLFVLNCSFFTMAMPAIAGGSLLTKNDVPDSLKLMFGELSVNIEPKEFNFEINPVSIGAGDNIIELRPAINDRTIGFEL
jgi:hypothetical protein